LNAFNRLILILVALLLIAVPVLLVLIALGVLSADQVNAFTGYRSGLDALGNLTVADLDNQRTRIILGAASALLALLALILLLRELSFGRRVARNTVVDEAPGRETVVTASAVKTIVEGAAKEAGAVSPKVSLASEGRPYRVFCKIRVPASGGSPDSNFAELAARTRENVRNVLERSEVPFSDVEVTVQGTES
jgi:hypothetical protein